MTIISPLVIEEESAKGSRIGHNGKLEGEAGCLKAARTPTYIPSSSPHVSRLRNEVARCRVQAEQPWTAQPSVGTWLASKPSVEPQRFEPQRFGKVSGTHGRDSAAAALDLRPSPAAPPAPPISIAPPGGYADVQVRSIASPITAKSADGATVNVSSPVWSSAAAISCEDAMFRAAPSIVNEDEVVSSPVEAEAALSFDDAMFRTGPLPEDASAVSPACTKSADLHFDDAMFRTAPLVVNAATAPSLNSIAPPVMGVATLGIAPVVANSIAPTPAVCIAPPAAACVAPPAAVSIAPCAGQR